jgi:hypothetical protein
MADRHPGRVRGAEWVVLLLAICGCSSRAESGGSGVAQAQSALADGGVASSSEYSVFVASTIASGPTARMKPSMAFDAKNGASVLFGGYALGTGVLNETWEYGGAGVWTNRCEGGTCSSMPAARQGAGLAYVPGREVTVLFGGVNGSGSAMYCDTWEWSSDARHWEPKSQPDCSDASSVARRVGHAMAGAGSSAIVFGGLVQAGTGASARSNDLSAWNGQGWSTLCDEDCRTATGGLPSPRKFATLVHAPLAHPRAKDVLWLFGGDALADGAQAGAVANDLWEFDLNTSRWTRLCSSAACKATAPEPRTQHAAVFDPVRGRMIVHGGCRDTACQTFFDDAREYDPETDSWSPVPRVLAPGLPAARIDFPAVFDVNRGRVVEFGGSVNGEPVRTTVEWYTRGGACSSGSDCHTGVCRKPGNGASGACVEECTGTSAGCVSGFACDSACDAPCQSCSVVPGVCTAVTSGHDDEPGMPEGSQCAGTKTCAPGPTAAAGSCKLDRGQPCTVGTECASTICSAQAPNVCIDVVCNQPCQIPEAGTCVARGIRAEPAGIGCNGLRCGNQGACLEKCTGNGDCVPDYFCDRDQGKCLPLKEPGEKCSASTDCKLGHCVDGVCCDKPCDGQCQECGSDGICKLRPRGSQPADGHTPCLGSGICGGFCDGTASCVQPNESTSCDPAAACTDRDFVRASGTCNGLGACVPPAEPTSCGAFTCNATAAECFRECSDDSQCRRGAICNITSDGHGVCNDEGVVCEGDFNLRTPRGIVDCEGYPCNYDACAFKGCVQGNPRDCAPGFECTSDHLCVPERPDSGKPPARAQDRDAGTSKSPPRRDAGDGADAGSGSGNGDLASGDSSCHVTRMRPGASGGSVLLFAGLSLLSALRRRRTGARDVPTEP